MTQASRMCLTSSFIKKTWSKLVFDVATKEHRSAHFFQKAIPRGIFLFLPSLIKFLWQPRSLALAARQKIFFYGFCYSTTTNGRISEKILWGMQKYMNFMKMQKKLGSKKSTKTPFFS